MFASYACVWLWLLSCAHQADPIGEAGNIVEQEQRVLEQYDMIRGNLVCLALRAPV